MLKYINPQARCLFFPLLLILGLSVMTPLEASAFGGGSADSVEEDNGGGNQNDNGNIELPEEDGNFDLIRARWEAKARDGANWTEHTYNRLDELGRVLADSVPADVEQFCANYRNLDRSDRKNFWVYLISSMAELESSHNPETRYREAFKDAKGNYVWSRGLLQISIESGNGYGCGFRNSEELHDPYKNLDCGIRILSRWVGRDGRIAGKVGGKWRGGARYWSVLRTSSKVGKIKGWNQTQRICQN